MALTLPQQFAKMIDDSTKVLVVFPKDGSVDHVATALAVAEALRRRGKSVDVCAEGFVLPQSLKFLKGAGDIMPALRPLQTFVISLNVARTKADEISYAIKGDKLEISVTPKSGAFSPTDISTNSSAFVYQSIVIVGAPDLASLGSIYSAHPDFFYSTPKVVIDCSPANERFGTINCVDVVASSCAEAVLPMLRDFDPTALNEDVATALITSMIAATKRFSTSTVTPRTLEAAAELVGRGARRDEAMQQLYRTRSLGTLKLWGRALARLKYDATDHIAWTLLVRSDFVHAGADASELGGVIEELMVNTPDAETFAIIYESSALAAQDSTAGQVVEALVTSTSGKHHAKLAALSPITQGGLSLVRFPSVSIADMEKRIISSLASLPKS